jgi:hypothetical protein
MRYKRDCCVHPSVHLRGLARGASTPFGVEFVEGPELVLRGGCQPADTPSQTTAEFHSVAVRYPLRSETAGQTANPPAVEARGAEASFRIPSSQHLDRQRVGVSAGQRLGDTTRTKRRIPVAAHTPGGYDEGPPTGKRPGQRPFSVCGRCRIRTCVGIRRRIYRTTLPTR